MHRCRIWLIMMMLVAAAPRSSGQQLSTAEGLPFFESRIRPVLIDQCYACHNSADTAEGGLAVDSRDAFRKGGENGRLIVPGDPQASRLIAILKHEIEGLEMPQDGPKLDDRVIADFARWIANGAIDPRDQPPTSETLQDATSWPAKLQRRKQWWSFQPIADPELPGSNDWSDHPIDRFIHAGLAEAGLSPASPASSEVLIRRLFLNLVGLPPEPDQLRQWLQRYEHADPTRRDEITAVLIDELLSSVHYGERWARHWMDWIRYAESHGSEGDPRIANAWRYRDYLIRAINEDVPYDQLVREHLAGDLLADPRINTELNIDESRIGPAHLRMVFHGFAPTDALDEKVRFVDDQINAVSKAFLGLTVSCARCHDHKFDAISQKDYYAWFGIFGSCRPGRVVVDLPETERAGCEELSALKPRLRDALADDWMAGLESSAEWIGSDDVRIRKAKDADNVLHMLHQLRKQVDEGIPFAKAWQQLTEQAGEMTTSDESEAIATWDFSDADDFQSWTATGIGMPDRPAEPGEFAVAAEGNEALTGIYPAGVYSHLLSAKHAARLTSGDIELSEPAELWVRGIGDGESTLRYVVRDYPRNGTVYPVTNLKPKWNWQRYDLSYWQGDQIHIELSHGQDAPLLVRGGNRSWFGVTAARVVKKGSPPPRDRKAAIDLLLAAAGNRQPDSIDDVIELYRIAFADAVRDWREGSLDDRQAELLNAGIRQGLLANSLDALPTARPLVEAYRRVEAKVPVATRVPGLEETTGRTQPLFVRGNHKQPGELVPRRFLEAIDPEPYATSGSGRLELAEDLLREDNPLTRRVIVNRIWHHLFGRGIVATPDNFGRLGQQPSHPELLDYLAQAFSDRGWSIKEFIRFIVSSKTWQLSSMSPAGVETIDADNALLSHANIRRMEAEVIRDSLLTVSGRLDRSAYGPPAGENSTRRSIYLPVIRNSLNPFLRAFDFPEPFSTTGRRDVTNVPAQSLTMMNDPAVAGHAAAFAQSILDDDALGGDETRIEELFLNALGRLPTDDEVDKTQSYLAATSDALTELRQRASRIKAKIELQQSQISAIMKPAAESLRAAKGSTTRQAAAAIPTPIASWAFDENLEDAAGHLNGKALGKARVDAGALVTGGRAHVVTTPLTKTLTEKTLEAWVKLDHLEQRGGGVMTVQTSNGSRFDSIVFGEQQPLRWLAGSEFFNRTERFGGPAETEADKRFVHLAIAYHADGMIVAYRDGQAYGEGYRSDGPLIFQAGEAVVSFGVRHLPASGNRVLAGRIERARLYDRALTPEQVAASFESQGPSISQSQVLASLSPHELQQVERSQARIGQLEIQLKSLGSVPQQVRPETVWTDLAHSLFLFKEFIYVR